MRACTTNANACSFGSLNKTHSVLEGKRLFLTEGFRADKRFDNAMFNQLIVQIGRGKIIHPNPVDIDFTLMQPNEKLSGVYIYV